MSKSLYLMSVASTAGLVFSLAASAQAQNVIAVPNSATRVNCLNGTGTATSAGNQDVSADQSVPGTPVTALNPFGSGTTSSETPLLTKPVSAATIQCPHSALPSANVSKNASKKAHAKARMNALSSNPNGATWLDKYTHGAKTASGGGS
jgi:hypothetical protein